MEEDPFYERASEGPDAKDEKPKGMADNYRKGSFRPYYVINEELGEVVAVYLTSDAIMRGAGISGTGANPLLDDINQQLRDEGIIEKLKSLYRTDRLDKGKP